MYTVVAPVKLVPVIVTKVPPAAGPEVGLNDVMVGAGALYVNASASVPLPPMVVTATLTGPAEPAGVMTVTWVAESTIKLVAAVAPKLTALAPVKLAPVMVTEVPPVSGPE